MKPIYTAALIGLLWLLAYAAMAFVLWDLNPAHWVEGARAIVVLVDLVILWFYVEAHSQFDKPEERDWV